MSVYVDTPNGTLEVTGDGEIISDVLSGEDRLAIVAQDLIEAADQKKAWTQREEILKAAFVRWQTEKRAAYGDVVVSIRQNLYTKVDSAGLVEFLEQTEAPRELLLAIIRASKVPHEIVPNPDLKTQEPGKVFAVCERARKTLVTA